MTMIPCPYSTNQQRGFTLIELVMIIVILGILSATVYVRWPVGMEEEAAVKEFRRAVRFAQHVAITQQYTTPQAAWGITVAANNSYSVQRADGSEITAMDDYLNRCLNDDCAMSLTGGSVWFNGLGEPIYQVDDLPLHPAGTPLAAATVFTINGARTVTIAPQTGYISSP